MKLTDLFEAKKVVVSQAKVYKEINRLAIECITGEGVNAAFKAVLKYEASNDTFFDASVDSAVKALDKVFNDTSSWTWGEGVDAFREAVDHVAERIHDYYGNKMNFGPGEQPKVKIHVDYDKINETEIVAAIKRATGRDITKESVNEGSGPNAFSLLAAENKARKQKEREKAKAEEKAYRAAHKPKKPEKMPAAQIYNKALDFANRGFPDCDPIDYLGPWMDKNHLTIADVDKAFRAHGEKSWNRYLIDMWNQHADQALFDVKNAIKQGRTPEEHSLTFVKYDSKTKKVTKHQNPWK